MKATQWLWEATWQDQQGNKVTRLFSGANLKRVRIKAEKRQAQERFDGEMVSLSRREDVVI